MSHSTIGSRVVDKKKRVKKKKEQEKEAVEVTLNPEPCALHPAPMHLALCTNYRTQLTALRSRV